MHAIAHEGCMDTLRESAPKVDSGRKIPCRTRESNLPQWCGGPTLNQLSCIPAKRFQSCRCCFLCVFFPPFFFFYLPIVHCSPGETVKLSWMWPCRQRRSWIKKQRNKSHWKLWVWITNVKLRYKKAWSQCSQKCIKTSWRDGLHRQELPMSHGSRRPQTEAAGTHWLERPVVSSRHSGLKPHWFERLVISSRHSIKPHWFERLVISSRHGIKLHWLESPVVSSRHGIKPHWLERPIVSSRHYGIKLH